MTRPDSPSVVALAEKIFNHLRSKPHEPITRKELAKAMGTGPHNTIFGMALAEARNMASRAGDCITSCSWSAAVKAHAMRYLPAGEENGELLVPLVHRSAVTQRHMGSLQREARFGMSNGADETTRLYASYLDQTLDEAGKKLDAGRELALTAIAAVERTKEKEAEVARLERELEALRRQSGGAAAVPAADG
ncbi:hypothetical protein ACFU0X_10350 [Streptomyces cellulosae]|uniref:Uncharacterized protein n=1 Tax=Streptomyces cellulosae TaxID=1968 RepID=A0ABW6JDK9_STRCE